MSIDHAIDKTGWGAGPWQEEPDKVVWIDPSTGLDAMAVRNHMGAWCGYVGVPPGHPWHGLAYDEIQPQPYVHGGLTYAKGCQGPICHVPAPGRPDDVWWVGFDCGHHMDFIPGYEIAMRAFRTAHYPFPLGEVYRTIAYVRSEVMSLAAQAWEVR